jgi:tight adherence protein B
LAIVGAAIPYFYREHETKDADWRRLRKQLPEAYDLIARALRAGQTISQTMQGVADEFAQPIAAEFSYCYEQQNLGLPTEVALRDLARRTGLLEINIFRRGCDCPASSWWKSRGDARRAGRDGEGSISDSSHDSRSDGGRKDASWDIDGPAGGLIFLAMLVMNRAYAVTLFDYPGLLLGIVVSMGLGALWIRKIINF